MVDQANATYAPAADIDGDERPKGMADDIGADEYASGSNNAPGLEWTGEANYTTDGVNPDSAVGGSNFEFRVKYTDIDNDAPTLIQVWVDEDDSGAYEAGEKYSMTIDGGDSDYTNGENFTKTLAVDYVGDGSLKYRFYAFDGTDVASGTPISDSSVTVTNNAPTLAWTGEADYDGDGVSRSLTSNVNYTLEAVQVVISIDHEQLENLGVELYSPSGTKSIILNINSSNIGTTFSNFTLLTNAFYGESSKGQWTLRVIDGAKGNVGVLKNWKLNVIGHLPAGTLKSQQKFPENILFSKNRKKLDVNIKSSKSISVDAVDRHAHPADTYLLKSTEEFLWATNIFAIEEKDYSGPSSRIIGDLFSFKVIESIRKPSKGYYVVKSLSTHKVGFYTGMIYAFGKDKKIEKFLRKRSFKWSKVAGMYIIEAPYLSSAIVFRKNLRYAAPGSTVELSIYYNQLLPN